MHSKDAVVPGISSPKQPYQPGSRFICTAHWLRLIESPSLSLFAQNTDILNTAVLTGEMVSVPVKTLAVEADGSVTDVTNYTSCRSIEQDVLKVRLIPW